MYWFFLFTINNAESIFGVFTVFTIWWVKIWLICIFMFHQMKIYRYICGNPMHNPCRHWFVLTQVTLAKRLLMLFTKPQHLNRIHLPDFSSSEMWQFSRAGCSIDRRLALSTPSILSWYQGNWFCFKHSHDIKEIDLTLSLLATHKTSLELWFLNIVYLSIN